MSVCRFIAGSLCLSSAFPYQPCHTLLPVIHRTFTEGNSSLREETIPQKHEIFFKLCHLISIYLLFVNSNSNMRYRNVIKKQIPRADVWSSYTETHCTDVNSEQASRELTSPY